MAKTVSTQKGLELELQRRINLALNGGTKTAVENCLKKHIQEDVLDVYQPKYMSAAARAKEHWKPTAAW